jgi:Ca2+-binding EF-hand superfamily protein
VEDLLKIIDKNRSGLIDFNEFISAIYSRRKLFEVKNLEDVFGYLDRDNSGSIEKNELKSILVGIEDEEIEYLFA